MRSPLHSLLVALAVRAMTTPKDAKDLFAEAQAAFTPVVCAPNDDVVKPLIEAFINALQSINVPGGAVNLSDILLLDNDHKAKHGGYKTFERMEAPFKHTTTASPPTQTTTY